MVYFTEQRRFEITNLVHRKLWEHRGTNRPFYSSQRHIGHATVHT